MQRHLRYNPKRGVAAPEASPQRRAVLAQLAREVRYGGNPEHKRNPGDFGLTPPAEPRRGKTLCDDAKIFRRSEALLLLREGLRRGLVDARWTGEGWPKLVWAVDANGTPLEAQREADGTYHGYPMPKGDPLRSTVTALWATHDA
jgi:hypothetical protein